MPDIDRFSVWHHAGQEAWLAAGEISTGARTWKAAGHVDQGQHGLLDHPVRVGPGHHPVDPAAEESAGVVAASGSANTTSPAVAAGRVRIAQRVNQGVHRHLEARVAGDHDVEPGPPDRCQQPPVPRDAVEVDVEGLEQGDEPMDVIVPETGEQDLVGRQHGPWTSPPHLICTARGRRKYGRNKAG